MKNKYSKEFESSLSKREIAKKLRQILHPSIDDCDVENISICLLCHLLIENRFNDIICRWLIYDLPFKDGMNEGKIKGGLPKKIVEMNFSTKYKIIEPIFSVWFKEPAETIWEITSLRNDIFHGRSLKNAEFKGKSINSEGVIANLFTSAQEVVSYLDMFDELLDSRRALAEKWSKRLKKLGQPLI